MPRRKPIRVLLVEDNRRMRQGIRMRLEHADGIVVAEATTGEAAIERARLEQPDVILMDLHLPGIDGLQAMREILAASPRKVPRVIVLTSDVSDRFVVEAMTAGAVGYLLKSHDTDRLVDTVRRALDGESTVSPRMTPRILRELTELSPHERDWKGIESLSPAERRVTTVLASGRARPRTRRSRPRSTSRPTPCAARSPPPSAGSAWPTAPSSRSGAPATTSTPKTCDPAPVAELEADHPPQESGRISSGAVKVASAAHSSRRGGRFLSPLTNVGPQR